MFNADQEGILNSTEILGSSNNKIDLDITPTVKKHQVTASSPDTKPNVSSASSVKDVENFSKENEIEPFIQSNEQDIQVTRTKISLQNNLGDEEYSLHT